MKKIFSVFIITLCIVSCVQKPTEVTTLGSVHGTVWDDSNKSELEGATVSIQDIGNRTTDENGYYKFDDLEEDTYTVTVSKTGYVTKNGQVEIEAKKDKELNFTLRLAEPAELSVTPTNLNFGQTVTQLNINVNNAGDEELSWQIASNQSWLTSFPTTGTTTTETDQVTATVNRGGLAVGNYNGALSFTSNGGDFNVPVQMEVTPAILSISTTELNFGNSLDELGFTITATGSGDLNWSLTADEDWINVQPTEGTLNNDSEDINVTVDREGLDPDIYDGNIHIESNGGNKDISITMEVPDFPAPVLNDPDNITESSMSLSWNVYNINDIAEYKLYRSEEPGVTQNSTLVTTITTPQTMIYNDTGLDDGTTYYYRIYSVSNSKVEVGSNEVSATTTVVLGDWGVQTIINENIDLYTVYALNDEFVYAAGDSGKVYFYDGNSWVEKQTIANQAINDLIVIDEDNIWMVGEEGVFHFNGTYWYHPIDSPTNECYCVDFCANSNAIWFGSTDGSIWYYDGNIWNESSVNSWYNINDIQINNEEDGIMVTGLGEVYKYNGYNWSLLCKVNSSVYYYCLAYFNDSDIWLGGSNVYGEIAHWDGNTFNTYNADPIDDIFDIGFNNSNSVWFVGVRGDIYYWNGNDLSSVESSTYKDINSIKMTNSSDGWAVGEGGVVLRYHK